MLGVFGLQAYYRLSVALAPGATQLAAWTDGTPAVAIKGRAVAINAYLGDTPKDWSGDFARIIANAGFTLRRAQNVCSSTYAPLVLR